MDQLSIFFSKFTFGGLISIEIGPVKGGNFTFLTPEKFETFEIPGNVDVYFGPAMRKTAGNDKEDILGSQVFWVDYDNANKPQWTIPPTYAVFSGHGWHCYWMLDKPCLDAEVIEKANKLLADDLNGDDCWNVNRILRVPGTTNLKEPSAPVKVEFRVQKPELIYTLDDILVLEKIPRKTRHKVATGDSRGHRSRSERDWKVLMSLVNAGCSDNLIFKLFDHQPIGDKHRDSGSNTYLEHTLEKIHEKPEEEIEAVAESIPQEEQGKITAQTDGMYIAYKKQTKRISTFVLDPTLLLDGSAFKAEDAIVCDVSADSYKWPGITFPRSAFTTVSKMDKATPLAAWQFLGKEDELRKMLPYLLDSLKQKGLPKVSATKTVGLHRLKDQWLFLGDKQTLSHNTIWQGFEGPLAWLPSETEHPELTLESNADYPFKVLGELIPQLNEPEVIWPMIGWYTAANLKPWIESAKYRFPILNVAGTKGSGKTTLIQKIFLPLWGQQQPKTFDAGTTRFVTLALMGSSNASPIAFSEFRIDSVQRFLRYVLLSYDTGHDPRGTAAQTTIDYPLQAPFSLDGEDLIDDPAARERIVVARLHPQAVEEGSPAYVAYKELVFGEGIPSVAANLIMNILAIEPEWPTMLQKARDAVFQAFPNKLPDRVRNNHVVTYFGILLWCRITATEPPDALVLKGSIGAVHNLESGRTRTLCDDMIEYLANLVNSGGVARFKYTASENVFWFQLTPAHEDWIYSRRRQGRGSLERDAMKTQLSEAPYHVAPQVKGGVWMYGIDLEKASSLGLDVPVKINLREFKINV